MRHRFHILGVPHTISTPDYSACAFTQKVVKLCKLLKSRGHHVIHYGHELSQVDCDEHVTVIKQADLEASYGNHDYKRDGFPRNFRIDDQAYQVFYQHAIAAIAARKQPRDFLLCPFGDGHKAVADAHADLIVCEPGIGYAQGGFAKFRVFESYAIMHAHCGLECVRVMTNENWYDAVIPNYFDLDDFQFSMEKEDYFLFVGRVNPGKGINIALQIVEELDGRLLIAGAGELHGNETRTKRPVSEYAKMLGVIGPGQRRELMSKAKATLAPSMFLEPFCGVQIESMLSGTPVISSDWGAFAEYNIHGVTGYRCRTFEQFTWAARNIDRINPIECRQWAAENFSLNRIGEMYDEYFYSVRNVFDGAGWYEPNPGRSELDWLERR